MTDSGAEALMCAIVRQAITDWKKAVRKLHKDWGDRDASKMQRECERFFRSGYCYDMTGIPADELIERIWRTME